MKSVWLLFLMNLCCLAHAYAQDDDIKSKAEYNKVVTTLLGTWEGTIERKYKDANKNTSSAVIWRIQKIDRDSGIVRMSQFERIDNKNVISKHVMEGIASGGSMPGFLISVNFRDCGDVKLDFGWPPEKNSENIMEAFGSGDSKSDGETEFYVLLNKIDNIITDFLPNYKPNTKTVQTDKGLSEGATLLFKNVKSKLTAERKNFIFEETGFSVSKDKQQFMIAGGEDHPFNANVSVSYMGEDTDVEGVLISYGNTFTSGMTGGSVMFFHKKGPKYIKVFDMEGAMVRVIPSTGPVPCLVVVGRGFSFPWYMWMGYYWMRSQDISEKELSEYPELDFEDLAKAYGQGGIDAVGKKIDEQKTGTATKNEKNIAAQKLQLEKSIAQKKGKPNKFLGKWLAIGNYNAPFLLSKVADYYTLSQNDKKIIPKLIFNPKLDQLEGWQTIEGTKYKALIKYNYKKDAIIIAPEQKGIGRSFELIPYK